MIIISMTNLLIHSFDGWK